MNIEGPNLPKGWRYPAGKTALKRQLGSLPGMILLRHRPSSGGRYPPDDKGGLIVEARYTDAIWMDGRPSVDALVYGLKTADYPSEARREFAEVILPDMADFFRQALSGPLPADGIPYAQYEVRWKDGRHHVTRFGPK